MMCAKQQAHSKPFLVPSPLTLVNSLTPVLTGKEVPLQDMAGVSRPAYSYICFPLLDWEATHLYQFAEEKGETFHSLGNK
jgi:hypothetical protein